MVFAPYGFTPHRHQAQGWARLSSLSGVPRPTMVTTGIGLGKTENFPVEFLDTCPRSAGTQA